jgi:glycosyltransferase involved in cell wall biosynthesis
MSKRSQKKSLADPAFKTTRAITETRLACGKTLVEMTTYRNTAMWWFIDAEFYYALASMLNTRLGYGLWRHRARRIYNSIEFLVLLLENVLVRGILGLYGTEETNHGGGERKIPKIMFTAQDWQWRVTTDQETGFTKKSDAFFDSILRKLSGKCEFVGVDPLTPLHLGLLRAQISKWKILVDKLRNWYIPQRPLELYWCLDVWRTERAAAKYFRDVWRSVRNDSEFRVICARTSASACHLMESQLEYYFLVAFPRAARYIHMAKRMIEKEKPDLILMLNEYGLFERATVITAKQLGVPTVAVQHGVIHLKHRGYMHGRDEISPDGGPESPYCPIPDQTAVYGPFYKHLLTRLSAYPEDRVVVTGQPRYDRIAHMERLYSRERFLQEHGIDPEHKVILWTTQCHGLTMEENHRNFTTVLETMSRLEKVTLVIKQHPGEGPTYTRMIRNYLSKRTVDAVITPGNSDVYEQLFACDLLIAQSSTTIMEAAALGKPVIVLNLTGEPPPIGLDYVKEGVAVEVSGEKELASAIEELLTDDRKLARNRKRFIEKYLYKLDGRATDRVINLIWKTMRNTENKHLSLYA